jgi:hypothetical protein
VQGGMGMGKGEEGRRGGKGDGKGYGEGKRDGNGREKGRRKGRERGEEECFSPHSASLCGFSCLIIMCEHMIQCPPFLAPDG